MPGVIELGQSPADPVILDPLCFSRTKADLLCIQRLEPIFHFVKRVCCTSDTKHKACRKSKTRGIDMRNLSSMHLCFGFCHIFGMLCFGIFDLFALIRIMQRPSPII